MAKYIVLSDWSTYDLFPKLGDSKTGPWIVVLDKKVANKISGGLDFHAINRRECLRIFSLNNPSHLRTLADMIESALKRKNISYTNRTGKIIHRDKIRHIPVKKAPSKSLIKRRYW